MTSLIIDPIGPSDAPVCRDEDVNGDDDCTDARTDVVRADNEGDEHLRYCQDANFNVTALVDAADASGEGFGQEDVVERYEYDPHGSATVLHGVRAGWNRQGPAGCGRGWTVAKRIDGRQGGEVMVRKIIRVDEDQCTGCGECVHLCRLGALEVSGGKARLVADRLCDGLGVCATHCPYEALLLERREAAPFVGRSVSDAEAARLAGGITPVPASSHPSHAPAKRTAEATDEPDTDDIFHYRLGLCCRTTQCGRLCQRLVKQPGKAGVWCVDVRTGRRTDLYEALAQPSFTCPEGVF